jgi:hypothetical protein
MDEDRGLKLDAVGAKAVNAAAVEQEILRQVSEATGDAAGPAPSDTEARQRQLWAVRRELRAVRTAVAAMERPPEEQDDLIDQDDDFAPPVPPPLAQGELQQAVMRERLAGLEAQAAELEAALRAAGVAPEEHIPEEAVQQALLEAQKGKKGRKKARKAAVEIEEADLFDAAEAVAAGGRGASLVETERDRLIRLVRNASCAILFHFLNSR